MVSHLYNISFIFLTSPFMVDFIVYIRVIRVIRSTNHPLFSFVIMSFCFKKNICLHLSLCHSVVKKIICLHFSLCHSVSKKSSISIFHYVILSSRKSSISICHCVILSQKNHLSPFVIMSFCLKKMICLHPSLCYSVSKYPPVFICPYVTLSPIYSVCIVLKSLDKDACKGSEKRRGICIRNESVTIMYSAGYREQRRRRLISIKKGVFYIQEGHVLEARRASS